MELSKEKLEKIKEVKKAMDLHGKLSGHDWTETKSLDDDNNLGIAFCRQCHKIQDVFSTSREDSIDIDNISDEEKMVRLLYSKKRDATLVDEYLIYTLKDKEYFDYIISLDKFCYIKKYEFKRTLPYYRNFIDEFYKHDFSRRLFYRIATSKIKEITREELIEMVNDASRTNSVYLSDIREDILEMILKLYQEKVVDNIPIFASLCENKADPALHKMLWDLLKTEEDKKTWSVKIKDLRKFTIDDIRTYAKYISNKETLLRQLYLRQAINKDVLTTIVVKDKDGNIICEILKEGL